VTESNADDELLKVEARPSYNQSAGSSFQQIQKPKEEDDDSVVADEDVRPTIYGSKCDNVFRGKHAI